MVCILSSEGYNIPHHLMSFFYDEYHEVVFFAM